MHDNFDSAFDELLEKGFIEYVEKDRTANRNTGSPPKELSKRGSWTYWRERRGLI